MGSELCIRDSLRGDSVFVEALIGNGQLFVGTSLAGPGIAATNDFALLYGTPGPLTVLARRREARAPIHI